MASEEERDVARYVLAYLIEMNYSQTTAAFLEECGYLKQTSSNNVMILPKTSLKVLINEYKSRQNTGIMIKTLGAQQAWKSLWSKLQHTLEEISSLAQDSLPPLPQTSKNRSKKGNVNTKFQLSNKSTKPPVSLSTPTTAILPLSPHTLTGISTTPTTSTLSTSQQLPIQNSPPPLPNPLSLTVTSKSPRKKRMQVPKRMDAKTVPVSPAIPGPSHAADESEDVQQLLDSLMSNDELPWRLAQLINLHHATGSDPNTSVTDSIGLSDSDVVSTNGGWLDDIINSMIPSTESIVPPKPLSPNPNEQPLESVSAEVIPQEEVPTSHSQQTTGCVVNDRGCKRQLQGDGGSEIVKRQKSDNSRYDVASTSGMSLQLPDGVNLEQFLDKIHK